jgi:hypothetical protein
MEGRGGEAQGVADSKKKHQKGSMLWSFFCVEATFSGKNANFSAKILKFVPVLVRLPDLTFMRMRTKKHEIMVAPDRDYLLIVIQNTNEC